MAKDAKKTKQTAAKPTKGEPPATPSRRPAAKAAAAKKTAPAAAPASAKGGGRAPPPLVWEQQSKDTWWAPDPTDASLYGARIKMMSNTYRGRDAAPTYSVTRSDATTGCTKYLGSDPTLEAAKRRAQYREQSPSVLRDEAAGGVPAFLALSSEERRAAWVKSPPPARPTFGFGQRGRAQVEAGRSNIEDPAVAKAEAVRKSLTTDKPAKVERVRVDSAKFADSAVIRMLVDKNHCKPNTGKHARFELLMAHDGKTVGEYRAAGGNMETLENAVRDGRTEVKS